MTNAPVTSAERAIQSAITDLWYQTYTKPLTSAQRNQLVDDFIAEHIDARKINVAGALFVHPMTSRKVKQRSATILEILADYIMRVDQVAENHSEYPVTGQESGVYWDAKRLERERVINFGNENDRNPEDASGRKPPYSINEKEFRTQESPVESAVFAEVEPSVEEFVRRLQHVNANAVEYATKYAKQGYDYADALRRIKRLQPRRVTICLECAEPFYRHDMRRKICDMQHGMKENGERSQESTCELNADKRSSAESREVRKTA